MAEGSHLIPLSALVATPVMMEAPMSTPALKPCGFMVCTRPPTLSLASSTRASTPHLCVRRSIITTKWAATSSRNKPMPTEKADCFGGKTRTCVELKQSHTGIHRGQQLVAIFDQCLNSKHLKKKSATACLTGVQTYYPSFEACNTP